MSEGCSLEAVGAEDSLETQPQGLGISLWNAWSSPYHVKFLTDSCILASSAMTHESMQFVLAIPTAT